MNKERKMLIMTTENKFIAKLFFDTVKFMASVTAIYFAIWYFTTSAYNYAITQLSLWRAFTCEFQPIFLPWIIILIWFAFRTPTVEKVLAFKISFIALLADFYAEKLAVITTNNFPYEIDIMTRVSSLIISVGIILLLISKFYRNVPKEVYYLIFFDCALLYLYLPYAGGVKYIFPIIPFDMVKDFFIATLLTLSAGFIYGLEILQEQIDSIS